MRIGDTPAEVRDFLYPPAPVTTFGSRETRSHTGFERSHFRVACSRCGAIDGLCISETGLPASAPHSERTVAAFFTDHTRRDIRL